MNWVIRELWQDTSILSHIMVNFVLILIFKNCNGAMYSTDAQSLEECLPSHYHVISAWIIDNVKMSTGFVSNLVSWLNRAALLPPLISTILQEITENMWKIQNHSRKTEKIWLERDHLFKENYQDMSCTQSEGRQQSLTQKIYSQIELITT